MATTTNFGWETPDDTDLVKDGAAAMRTLGNSIDTSFVDLKGGTTGQVLAKASATDLDYTWTTPQVGDITAVTAGTGISGGGTGGDVTITNSMATAIDAKGDLIAGTGADAFSRLAVGTNDQVLTADSTTATGLKWATPASGGMTSIASGSLPTGATNVTISSISGSYKSLQLIIRNPYPATSTSLSLQFNSNTGSVYKYNSVYYGTTGPISGVAVDSTTQLEISQTSLANAANNNLYVINIPDYAGTTYKVIQSSGTCVSASYGNFTNNMLGRFESTTAISSITIKNSSAVNFGGGTYVLYGVN